MLGNRTETAGNRRFLKCITADRSRRHLPADHNNRGRVRQAVPHRGYRVGGTRTGSHHDDTHLTAGTGVTGGHEPGALFIGGHD